MLKSSRLRDRWGGGEQTLVTRQRREHGDWAPGKQAQGLDVRHPLCLLPGAVVHRRVWPRHHGLRRQGEQSAQAPVVALGPVVGAGPAAGIPGHRDETSVGGRMVGILGVGHKPSTAHTHQPYPVLPDRPTLLGNSHEASRDLGRPESAYRRCAR